MHSAHSAALHTHQRPRERQTAPVLVRADMRFREDVFRSKATGVAALATARHEVILSAGVIGSPCLLMLSGIGELEPLQSRRVDITPFQADLPSRVLGDAGQTNTHTRTRVNLRCLDPPGSSRYRSHRLISLGDVLAPQPVAKARVPTY